MISPVYLRCRFLWLVFSRVWHCREPPFRIRSLFLCFYWTCSAATIPEKSYNEDTLFILTQESVFIPALSVAFFLLGIYLSSLAFINPISLVPQFQLKAIDTHTAGDGRCFLRKQPWKTCKVCVYLVNT